MVLYYSTDFSCFRFQYKRLPLRINKLLVYFAIAGENVLHKTCRGHIRLNGRKRYISLIQTSFAISCCVSYKGQPSLKEQHSL